jgi:3'(2'), 5'-bisphosphate nucleotidase
LKLDAKYHSAVTASIEASKKIMEVYESDFNSEIKGDGSPLTLADQSSSDIILKHLAKTNIPITEEESVKADFKIRTTWKASWCVDPLDGTKEFIKRNGEFAVSIALIDHDAPVFGVIASPVNQELLFGGKSLGVFICSFEDFCDTTKWTEIKPSIQVNTPLRMLVSRSHPSEIGDAFHDMLQKKFSEITNISMGSALKFFDLALGKADVYPRFAPTMEWDIAAGQAILETLGGGVFDAITGMPLRYNKQDLTNPFFIAKTAGFMQIML